VKRGIELSYVEICVYCVPSYRQRGFYILEESDELEDNMLDEAWGMEPESRLGCQAIVQDEDLVVEIPMYTINMVSESH